MARLPDGKTRLRVDALSSHGETPFLLEPDAETRAALAQELRADAIRKLRFEGAVSPRGRDGWALTGTLGATVVQPCVVTLEPVTTRIDAPVERRFVPARQIGSPEAGSETEMPEDDTIEPLGEVIDLAAIMAEALSLNMPAYPRKDGVELGEAVYAEDGVEPLRDEDLKPFARLAALQSKLTGEP